MNGYNFTERVRMVLAAARDESARLHHEYVGTEHILFALLRVDDGVATAVLANLNIDVGGVRQMLDHVVVQGKQGKPAGVDLPYTSRAKKLLELSMVEAKDLGHNYVGTEHLLLAMLREEKGIAAQVLTDGGLTLEAARDETLRLIGDGSSAAFRSTTFTAQVATIFPKGLDALEAAPQFHTLLLENEHVRVLDTRIPPGATTPLHTHRYPAAHYIRSWSHFIRRNEAGEVLLDTRQTDFSQNEPQALWGAALPLHTVENVGEATLHVVSVEVKSPIRRGV